jgi:hypothetical protein
MTSFPEWLPPLVLLKDYGGNWSRYEAALYSFFRQDFVDSNPVFEGTPVVLKRHPISQGKEATFWHLISEGRKEEDRLPDLRRCERIRWPRPVIEHSADALVKVWENQRRGDKRVCLWLECSEYLVILTRRRGYILLWTGYPVIHPHQKRKLQKEYEAYKKADAAP